MSGSDQGRPRLLAAAAVVVAALSVLPLWLSRYPPMVDLPQHAVQVQQWQRYGDPASGMAEKYERNWLTPYLSGYVLARALAALFPVPLAMKLAVALTVLALPAALHWLLRELGSDRWWCLWGFPIAYGFAFYWGFLNFFVSVPLGLCHLVLALRYSREPTVLRGGILCALTVLLFFAHLITVGLCCLIAGSIIVVEAGSLRAAVLRCLPFSGALVLVVAWTLVFREDVPRITGATEWGLGWQRINALFALLVSSDEIELTAKLWGVAAVGGLVALTLGGRPRPSPGRQPSVRLRLVPLVAWGAVYLLCPKNVFGIYFVPSFYGRLAVFFLPFLLGALPVPSAPRRLWGTRAFTVLMVVAWSAVLSWRFAHFGTEVEEFERVAGRVASNPALMTIISDPTSEFVPAFPFIHFGGWVHIEKGGTQALEFADFSHVLVRKRDRSLIERDPDLAWNDGYFSWDRHGGFDHYLLRGPTGQLLAQFRNQAGVRLVEQSGGWWLFRKEPCSTAQRCAPRAGRRRLVSRVGG